MDTAFVSLLTTTVILYWPRPSQAGEVLEPIVNWDDPDLPPLVFPAALVPLDPPGAWLSPSGEAYPWTHRLYLTDYKYVKDQAGAKVALRHGWKVVDENDLTYRVLGASPIPDLETGAIHHVELACDLEG